MKTFFILSMLCVIAAFGQTREESVLCEKENEAKFAQEIAEANLNAELVGAIITSADDPRCPHSLTRKAALLVPYFGKAKIQEVLLIIGKIQEIEPEKIFAAEYILEEGLK